MRATTSRRRRSAKRLRWQDTHGSPEFGSAAFWDRRSSAQCLGRSSSTLSETPAFSGVLQASSCSLASGFGCARRGLTLTSRQGSRTTNLRELRYYGIELRPSTETNHLRDSSLIASFQTFSQLRAITELRNYGITGITVTHKSLFGGSRGSQGAQLNLSLRRRPLGRWPRSPPPRRTISTQPAENNSSHPKMAPPLFVEDRAAIVGRIGGD